jgi:hypothetical protein
LGSATSIDETLADVDIVLGECVFKQKTRVVLNRQELDGYLETIAKIIDSERIWADPEMADFDIGEREDTLTKYKKPTAKKESEQVHQVSS